MCSAIENSLLTAFFACAEYIQEHVIFNARVKKGFLVFGGPTITHQGKNCTDFSTPEIFDTEGKSYYAITHFALSLLSQSEKINIFYT